jgi:hypothetical protein
MKKPAKWKNTLYLASAVGIIGLAAYGIYNTVDASNALAADNAIIADADSNQNSLTPGSTCSPYGCAGCTGCSLLQYQQNPVSTDAQLERTY